MWEMKCYLESMSRGISSHEIRKRKANCIGHILYRNCLLKQVIEGKVKGDLEVTRRRGRRRKKLLEDLKDRRGYSHFKGEALDRTVWRHRFGGDFGPVVRQNTEWLNEYPIYNNNWRNISTIYIYNKTSIKRNILAIKQNTSGSRSG